MKRGFTLIEVLVTLGVASVSLAAIAHSASAIVLSRRASERQQAATLIAERRMEELLANTAEDLSTRDAVESVGDAMGALLLRTIIEAGPRENLWHLSVTATPAGGGAPVRFHTLLRRRWVLP
jgi:prepilin-type N-terminal cleavage/methylation domain-containing protein